MNPKIIQQDNHVRLQFTFSNVQLLFDSLHIPLKNINNNNEIILYTNTIVSLDKIKQFDYELILNITTYLSNQIIYLQKFNYNLIGFDLSDIYLIDGKYCFLLNPSKLTNSKLYLPPTKSLFMSANNKELPLNITNKDTYYLIGIFINFLFSNKITEEPSPKCFNTKLYFFIKYAIQDKLLLLI
jgi:hypothetical protein